MPLEVLDPVLELRCPGRGLLLSGAGALFQQPTFDLFKLLFKQVAGLLKLCDVQDQKIVVCDQRVLAK